MKQYITKEYRVDYAHLLRGHEGKCRNIHGHTAKVTIQFKGSVRTLDGGMVIDFGNLGWLERIINEIDHAIVLEYKVDLPVRDDFNWNTIRHVVLLEPPTAENLCKYFMLKIDEEMSTRDMGDIELFSVSFEETPGNTASLMREDLSISI